MQRKASTLCALILVFTTCGHIMACIWFSGGARSSRSNDAHDMGSSFNDLHHIEIGPTTFVHDHAINISKFTIRPILRKNFHVHASTYCEGLPSSVAMVSGGTRFYVTSLPLLRLSVW